MKITVEKLKKLKAYPECIEWFRRLNDTDLKSVLKKAVKTRDVKILNYANWMLVQFLPKMDKIRYVVFAAEQVLGIYEKDHPNDDRPRRVIEAAKEYLKNPTSKNKDAAYSAANAADEAAQETAKARAHVSNTETYNASEVGIETLNKIIQYGIGLIK